MYVQVDVHPKSFKKKTETAKVLYKICECVAYEDEFLFRLNYFLLHLTLHRRRVFNVLEIN